MSVVLATGEIRTSEMTPLLCGSTADADVDGLPDATDATAPPLGDAFVYLPTGKNLTGEGPLGPLGVSPPRIQDAPCP